MAKAKPEHASNRKKHRSSTTWRPGQSGNPAGRPSKGLTLAEVMRELLDQEAGAGITKKQKLADCVYSMAVAKKGGAIAAARLIFEVVGGTDLLERFKRMEERLEILERENIRAVAS